MAGCGPSKISKTKYCIKLTFNSYENDTLDRGFHYKLEIWISLMKEYEHKRSMSRKGCSLDNSMCEGFFGTIKNEFFYSKNWKYVTCNEFFHELNKYLIWFKT